MEPETLTPSERGPDPSPTQKEFHFKEYETLKKEIADLVEHSRKLEIYAVGGIAAFYAWWFLRANPEGPGGGVPVDWKALLLPVLIVLMGGFRSLAVSGRIDEIAEYLVRVERVFALPKLGWERTLRRDPEPPPPGEKGAGLGQGSSPEAGGLPEKDEKSSRFRKARERYWKRSPFKTSGSAFWVGLLTVTLVALATLHEWC